MHLCNYACRAVHVYTYTVIYTFIYARPRVRQQELRRKAKEEILIEPRDALPRRSSLSGSEDHGQGLPVLLASCGLRYLEGLELEWARGGEEKSSSLGTQ